MVDSILTVNSQLMVYYGTSGRELALQVASTLVRVSITTSGRVQVTVPDSYRGKVCGLCGNYDGDSENDLRTSDGNYASSSGDIYIQGAIIARSYLVPLVYFTL